MGLTLDAYGGECFTGRVYDVNGRNRPDVRPKLLVVRAWTKEAGSRRLDAATLARPTTVHIEARRT
jgi:hypothetical protein